MTIEQNTQGSIQQKNGQPYNNQITNVLIASPRAIKWTKEQCLV